MSAKHAHVASMARDHRPAHEDVGDALGVGCMYVRLTCLGGDDYVGHVMALHEEFSRGTYYGHTQMGGAEVRAYVGIDDTRVEWLLFGLPVHEVTWLHGVIR